MQIAMINKEHPKGDTWLEYLFYYYNSLIKKTITTIMNHVQITKQGTNSPQGPKYPDSIS